MCSITTKTAVTHQKLHPSDPDRNLRILERQLAQGRALSPREQFYYARELDAHGRQEEAAALWEAFLAEDQGWVENKREACRDLSACYLRMGQEEKAFCRPHPGTGFWAAPGGALLRTLGTWFFQREDYPTAAFWYETALQRPRGRPVRRLCPPGLLRIFAPVCSCAYATTAWATWPFPRSTTAGQGHSSPTTLLFSTTSGFFQSLS